MLRTLILGVSLLAGLAAEDHAGHAHAPGAHGHDHGAATALGAVTVGAHQITVALAGAAVAGKECHVELKLTPAQPVPKAVRVWIGNENARGSVKSKATAEAPGMFDAQVEVPNPLPEGSRLWISIDPQDGDSAKGSVALLSGH